MTNEIQYTVEWTIKPGGLDAFKELAQKIIPMVESEAGMKGYQWYFNSDETKCYTVEWLADSDAIMAHLGNVGEELPKLFGHSDITSFEVFGNPNDQAKEALAGLGAVFNGYYGGFTK
jgi:quinol monooxygenase YgiN